jgi:mono/diheme cytochrome c family protein
MIKKILKFTGIFLGVITLVVLVYYAKVYITTEQRLHKRYDVQLQSFDIKKDSASLALGARLVKTKGCAGCHSADLGGKIFVNDAAFGVLSAANLTKGKGGRPSNYSEMDFVRALKHGLRQDGTALIFMPAHEYTLLSETDMGAIIAYCSTLPKVDRELPEANLGPLAKVLADLGKLKLFPAELIDHTRKLVKEVKAEMTIEYGQYLSTSCQGCHRETMKGGEPVAPGYPVVADITSTGHPGKWTDEQFIKTLRTGVTPEGKVLKPEQMPWPMAKELTDLELKALHLYLNSL